MTIDERINLVFAAPLGVLLGLVAALLVQAYTEVGPGFALILAGGAVLFSAAVLLLDRLESRFWGAAGKISGRKGGASEKTKGFSLQRKVFLGGVALGLVLSTIWEPADIIDLIHTATV